MVFTRPKLAALDHATQLAARVRRGYSTPYQPSAWQVFELPLARFASVSATVVQTPGPDETQLSMTALNSRLLLAKTKCASWLLLHRATVDVRPPRREQYGPLRLGVTQCA